MPWGHGSLRCKKGEEEEVGGSGAEASGGEGGPGGAGGAGTHVHRRTWEYAHVCKCM